MKSWVLKAAGAAFVALAIAPIWSFGVSRVLADDPVSGSVTSVDDALAAAPFAVARPALMPFPTTSSFGSRGELGSNSRIEQTYVGPQGYVSITAVRGPLALESKQFEVIPTALPDGTAARFVDNGLAQVLVWTRGDVSYHLAVSRTDRVAVAIAELGAVAASMR